jgi:hypothetical protein
MMLVAYHADPAIKRGILKQLRAHAKADEIVKGRYWEDGKGCAVGCTVHSNEHSAYETRFGIPEVLARLKETIFEGLPNGRAKEWPIQFMLAVKPGADLSRVHWHFLHWLLTTEAVNPGITHPIVRDAVKRCADLMASLSKGGSAAWSAAEASEALASAWSAAAMSAEALAAAWSATDALAAASAWSTDALATDALAAARSARSAAESRSARSAALAYTLMADRLLALIKEAT